VIRKGADSGTSKSKPPFAPLAFLIVGPLTTLFSFQRTVFRVCETSQEFSDRFLVEFLSLDDKNWEKSDKMYFSRVRPGSLLLRNSLVNCNLSAT
jgi:hypothetical protein